VSFRCRGHAGISGTHDKTVEFTRDRDVTRRATCVLGVESDHDDAEVLALRGAVEVTIAAAGMTDSFEAEVAPFFIGDDSLVFRRGPALRGRTFAGTATKSAADVDRALVQTLADPSTLVDVTVRELGRGDRRGVLFVVATPIGNDGDLSPRARQVLGAVDLVLAEDTRRFRDLVSRTGLTLRADVTSYHDHNEAVRADDALTRLAAGARIALVSDAGTPLCSDPGYVVVHRALDAGYEVSPVPGPSSLLAVLSASGLAVDRFVYAGFLPRRAAARQAEIRRLTERSETFVVHEAPHRVAALLADLGVVCPDWNVCAGREVTKVFEEFRRGTASELAAELTGTEPRGEFTLVVAPPGRADIPSDDVFADDHVDRLVRALVAQGVTTKTLAQALASLPGISRKAAYARVLAIAGDAGTS
jgi:16S rRNA (cytidine1402-2'-O)-methyltransferase